MTRKPEENTSPVCWLDDANDLYAGFATAAEIEARLLDWIHRAPSPEIAARLAALLPQSASLQPSKPGTGADDLRAEITTFLPKIRDDAMHATLQAIAQAV